MLKGNEDDIDFIDFSPKASPKSTPKTSNIQKSKLISMSKNSIDDIISSTSSTIFTTGGTQNKNEGVFDDPSELDSLFKSLISRSDEIEFNTNIKKVKDIL